jgi:hypothetical protein
MRDELTRREGAVQGEFEFSEDPPGKRVIDIQTEYLISQFFFMLKRSKSCLVLMGRSYLSFLGSQRSPQFSFSIFFFFWAECTLDT